METKHTKGGWISLGYRVDVDVADGLSGICEMADWMSEQEMEANAKLIAAAPSLLEACIAVNRYFISLQSQCALTKSDERAWKLVSGVIKKATE